MRALFSTARGLPNRRFHQKSHVEGLYAQHCFAGRLVVTFYITDSGTADRPHCLCPRLVDARSQRRGVLEAGTHAGQGPPHGGI